MSWAPARTASSIPAVAGRGSGSRWYPSAKRSRTGCTLLEQRQPLTAFLGVGADGSGDEFVFGLEVVVDVAERHVGGLRDIRDGRGFHSLAVNRFARAGYQAVSFSGPLACHRGRHRSSFPVPGGARWNRPADPRLIFKTPEG